MPKKGFRKSSVRNKMHIDAVWERKIGDGVEEGLHCSQAEKEGQLHLPVWGETPV